MQIAVHEFHFIVFSADDRVGGDVTRIIILCHQVIQDLLYWSHCLKNFFMGEVVHLFEALCECFLVFFEEYSTIGIVEVIFICASGVICGLLELYFVDVEE